METIKRTEYKKLFKEDNAIVIKKEDLLIIIKDILDPCIKLGNWRGQWEFIDEEDSIIPYDAGRIQGVIELIFNQEINTISRNNEIIVITFKSIIKK